MKFLEFLFKLIRRNVEVDDADFTLTQQQIQSDWDDVRIDNEDDEKLGRAKKTWKYYIKLYTESPYCKLILAILFIFAQRWIYNFMHPTDDMTEELENEGK